MAKRKPAPHGHGSAARALKKRGRKAKKLAAWLFPNLKVKKVVATGELFPRGSLQKNSVRKLFAGGWLACTSGKRWFTLPLCQAAVVELVSLLGVWPTRKPTQGCQDWVLSQAKRLHFLARAAKKSALRSESVGVSRFERKIFYVFKTF